jgi:hypothetical protein
VQVRAAPVARTRAALLVVRERPRMGALRPLPPAAVAALRQSVVLMPRLSSQVPPLKSANHAVQGLAP